jgi:hypothetical protein
MAFRLKTKILEETKTRRVAATAPLPQLPQSRHVPSPDDVRQHWSQVHAGGPIPAVANLFGDATGQLLQNRLAAAQTMDDFLAVADEARAYGDHEVAHLAVDRARSLAVRQRDLRQIDALESALQPSELEKALSGFGR